MNARAVIENSISMGKMITDSYLSDLSEDELMQRPHPKANHIKWQLGHLIASEHDMIEGCCPGSMPPLPEGFAEKYGKETAASDDASAFDSRDFLMATLDTQRNATMAALQKLSDEDLGRESPEPMRSYAPDVAAAFNMQGAHWVMHAGQWAVLRRQLGKPIVI